MAEIENTAAGPGELLTAARKKMGLSKFDISRQLNLSPAVIEQLESNQYTDQIPDAFLRGYLRTYARAVALDEDDIVTSYSEFTGSSEVANHYVPSTDVPPVKIQVGSHMLWFKLLSVAVFIAILILGWMAYNQTDPETATTDSSVLNSPLLTEQPKNEPVQLPTNEELTEQPVTDNAVEQNVIDSVVLDDVIEEVPETELPQGFVDEPVLTDAELAFNFIDDCWVQVIDGNDEVLAVGLKSAGRRFSVSGVPPITVVLGKPRAVSLQYNNQSVDLSIYPASQTARFILGDE